MHATDRSPADAPAPAANRARQEARAGTFYQRLATRLFVVTAVLLALLLAVAGKELREVAGDGHLLLVVALVLIAAAFLGALFLRLVVTPFISRPAAELAAATEAIADGDLTVEVRADNGNGQLSRLRRGVIRVVDELRRLAHAQRAAARETASLATRIGGSSRQMADRAAHTAQTAAELSARAEGMVRTIDAMAADAARLAEIAARAAEGAQEGAARNQQVRALAEANRVRLDAAFEQLARVGAEVRESAEAATALASASEEVQNFVTLVQKMARQSRLLSLNAAMEAARAGEHGDGFAVVANEVRRLAANSADAAARSEVTVASIVQRVQHSQSRAARALETVQALLLETRESQAAYHEMDAAVAASNEWTASLEQTASHSAVLVRDITSRLDELARDTQAFSAAMRQVAGASEAQSASIQEIAAAAAALSDAAGRLSRLVEAFKLDRRERTIQLSSVSREARPAAAPARRPALAAS